VTLNFSETALAFLFSCLLKATLVFTLAWAVASVARRSSAAFRHLVWAVAILGLLVLPVLAFLLPAWHFTVLAATARFWIARQPVATAPDLSDLPAMIVNAVTSAPARQWSSIFLLIWFLGVLFFALRIIIGLARLYRLSARCAPSLSPDLTQTASELSAAFNVKRQVSLLANNDPSIMPLTWGIFRPTILLPCTAAHWPGLRRRIVLTHEFAHVARRDWLFQICAELARAVYWFHPLVWLAAKRLRQESERACDDSVLRTGIAAPDYADQLLHLAATLKNPSRAWSSALAFARLSHLERRFSAMLDSSLDRRSLSTNTKTAASLFVLLLLVPLAALRLPAQNAAGKFSGTIYDASSAAVPNATIILTDPNTNKVAMTASDAQGKFAFVGMPPGDYELKAIKHGFDDYQAHQVLEAGHDATQNLTLKVGSVNDEVNVVAQGNARGASASPSGKTARIPVGGAVQASKIISKVQPVYPAAAKAAGSQGTVIIHAVIGMDGAPLSLRVMNDQIDPELARAAIEAVSKWRYSPTLLNGNPIEVDTTIHVNFTLQP
jgi:TonB family protein